MKFPKTILTSEDKYRVIKNKSDKQFDLFNTQMVKKYVQRFYSQAK